MSQRDNRPSTQLLVAGAGAVGASLVRKLFLRLVVVKLRRDVRALNAGDYAPLLAGFAQDAVLRFNEGRHRWAGEHRGKPAIERFLRDFVAAGLQGEIVELLIAGAPWRMTIFVRFDDYARAWQRRADLQQPHGARGAGTLGQDRLAGGLLRGHRADRRARRQADRARHRTRGSLTLPQVCCRCRGLLASDESAPAWAIVVGLLA